MFQEEGHADYDFALGGEMTANGFAQVVRGKRGRAPPPPPPQVGGASGTPSSNVQPTANQPFPDVGSTHAHGGGMCTHAGFSVPPLCPVEVG